MKNQLITFLLIFASISAFGQNNFDQTPSFKAANAFLNALTTPQKAVANLPFDDTSRVKWDNVPMEAANRKGIQIKNLSDSQHVLVHNLLRTVLSPQGYQKIMLLIQADEGIHERMIKANNPIAHRYGNQNYWVTIFATPQKDKIWAWKFEGHHISLNLTYSPRGITCTPMFVGVNPALTTTGAYAGYHLLFEENDFGTQLFSDLSDDLKKKSRISPHLADADVMTRTGKEPHMSDKKGVKYTEMTSKQQNLVENIIRTWAENLTPALAKENIKRILDNKNNLLFTWRGTDNINELHYFNIKTDTFIIEFSNRDQGIYHYHTLWRDLTEDFLSK